jgi:hypothetical protein
MNYEIFSYNNIRHILYISYNVIICSCYIAQALTWSKKKVTKTTQIPKERNK